MTVAVTLFALLELYKRGEATWEQAEPFGEITVEALAERPWPDLAGPATGGRGDPHARTSSRTPSRARRGRA